MGKLLLLLLAAAGGAAGATSWLLSEPSSPSESEVPTNPNAVRTRVDDLKVRLAQALREGERAGQDAEERLRRELDAYRQGATPPATQSR